MQKLFNESGQRIEHFNYPQQQAWIVNANTTVAIIGRGGGKTHGFIAPASIRNVKHMPRGATAFVGPTYMKIKGDLIPSLTKALEKLGFYEEVDYWIGMFIPKNVRHEKPFECPKDPSYSIFWRNGHVGRLIGMDRKDSGNAQSNDFIINDESKFLNIKDFNSRILPTNRGNEDVFSHLHFHHGLMFCTDKPTSTEAAWIFQYEKLMDPEQIDLIVSFDHQKQELLKDMKALVLKEQLTEALSKRFRTELKRLDDILFELRREAVFYIKASTLDNIDVVGIRYIRDMERKLTPIEFDTSILNLEADGVPFGFYGNFSIERHGYDDLDYTYLESQKDMARPDQPWKKDADLDISRGLHIACDWNSPILNMEVGQEFQHCFKYLNDIDVLHPHRIPQLAKAFDDYYKGYPNRNVVHHYDHTAIHEDASRERSYASELNLELSKLGWSVEDHFIGQASRHDYRYKMWGRVHAQDSAEDKPVRYNRTNCHWLIKSLQLAKAYKERGLYQKDKRPEKKATPDVDPTGDLRRSVTHKSDAHDTLYIGVFQDRIGDAPFEPDFAA